MGIARNFQEAHKTTVKGLLVYLATDDILRWEIKQRHDGTFALRKQSISDGNWSRTVHKGADRQADIASVIAQIEKFISSATE